MIQSSSSTLLAHTLLGEGLRELRGCARAVKWRMMFNPHSSALLPSLFPVQKMDTIQRRRRRRLTGYTHVRVTLIRKKRRRRKEAIDCLSCEDGTRFITPTTCGRRRRHNNTTTKKDLRPFTLSSKSRKSWKYAPVTNTRVFVFCFYRPFSSCCCFTSIIYCPVPSLLPSPSIFI